MRKGKKRCHCKHKKRGGGMMKDMYKKGKRMAKKAIHSHVKKHGKKYFEKGVSYGRSHLKKHGISV